MLLTAGKGVGLALGIAGQVNLLQQSCDGGLVLGLALQFQSQADIILHGEFVQNVILLENKTDEGVAVAVKIAAGEAFAASTLDDDLTLGGTVQTAAYIQKGGLTAAGLTQQKDHSRFGKTQGYPIQGIHIRAFFGLIDFL